MLRDEKADGDEDGKREDQSRRPDAAAPWVKIPRVIGVRHLSEKHRPGGDYLTTS
jgi:hypothetical protein